MRINKYLAHCGLCSRRKAEELILQGRVFINGEVVKELGTKVSEQDIVVVDGKVVKLDEDSTYLLLNKPVGYVSTVKDPFAKKTVLDLIDDNKRLYPVGRLDKDSRGLIIITNDGKLTYNLTHPKKDVFKTYEVILDRKPTEKQLDILRNGIPLDGYMTKRSYIRRIDNKKYEIRISEGRNRQVRRMFEYIGSNVLDLNRTAIGNLKDNNLKEGKYRELTKEEVKYLRSL